MTKANGIYLATGLLIGALAATLLVSWHWNRQFRSWYATEAYDLAFVIEEILSGRGDELAERNLESLPELLRGLDSLGLEDDVRLDLLRRFRAVYVASGKEPPPDIASLFADL